MPFPNKEKKQQHSTNITSETVHRGGSISQITRTNEREQKKNEFAEQEKVTNRQKINK